MRSRGIPTVLVDRLAGADQFCSVSVDDVAGGATALAHLLSVGAVRPAFVGGPFTLQQVEDRYRGAADAAAQAGIRLQLFENPDLKFHRGRQTGDLIANLQPSKRPDAVFAANDQLALGLLIRRDRRRGRPRAQPSGVHAGARGAAEHPAPLSGSLRSGRRHQIALFG
jgi:LacI family transcriptional regulator